MARPPYALIVLLVAVVCGDMYAQSTLAPEAGVLVLRNGQVLEGDVTRAGDYYILTKGAGSELRLKAEDVESFCGSLLEAYEYKNRRLSGLGATPHLDLARWCLRQQLYEQCSEQLDAATGQDPDSPQAKELRTRLALAIEAAPPAPAPGTAISPLSAEELEKAIRALPKASVEKFGAIVQPILLNRCGANQCHGPNAKSELRLMRPPPGQLVSRRFTQRNLHAAVKYLDQSNPDASPLVVMPQQRHGSALSAVFDKQSASQLAELIAWARLTIAAPQASKPAAPATIGSPPSTLSQPALNGLPVEGKPLVTPPAGGAVTAQPDEPVAVRAMRQALDNAGGRPAAPAAPPARPRDRFDPEIFNERYRGK